MILLIPSAMTLSSSKQGHGLWRSGNPRSEECMIQLVERQYMMKMICTTNWLM
ncbi:hypothetical protein DAI22_09g007300 [Oryza sativa Japonica Group]|nr:hypothetical protein DAI22_09g007300 [Oryza sativa Japonica Group]